MKYNSMSVRQYIIYSLLCAFFASVIFFNLFFTVVGNNGVVFSMILFILIFALGTTLGILITTHGRRNKFSVFLNVLMPPEMYLLVACTEMFTAHIIIAAVISVVLVAANYIAKYIRSRKTPLNNSRRKHLGLYKKITNDLQCARICVVSLFMMLILPVLISTLPGGMLRKPSVSSEKPTPAKTSVLIEKNAETFADFHGSKWSTLSTTEKLDDLQVLADIEAVELGLDHELNIAAGTLHGGLCAEYIDLAHLIIFDLDYLNSGAGEKIIGTLCHEAYHAYEYRLVDAYERLDGTVKNLYGFKNAKNYAAEFENYISCDDDIDLYKAQYCEKDAEIYAMLGKDKYCYYIEQYFKENKNKVEI